MQTEGFLGHFPQPRGAASDAEKTKLTERTRTESRASKQAGLAEIQRGQRPGDLTERRESRSGRRPFRMLQWGRSLCRGVSIGGLGDSTPVPRPRQEVRMAPSSAKDGGKGALWLACSLFPTSTISSSCPSSPLEVAVVLPWCVGASGARFITAMLVDWIGCTDQYAERALLVAVIRRDDLPGLRTDD